MTVLVPSSERGKRLARWCLKAFEDWVELEGEERAKKLFWETAASKRGSSPFRRRNIWLS